MGAGASATLEHVSQIIERYPALKRKSEKLEAALMLLNIARKSSDNREALVARPEVLKLLAGVSKGSSEQAVIMMRTIAELCREVSCCERVLDGCELCLVFALSSDNKKAWRSPTSKECWALLALSRLMRNGTCTSRLRGNGIADVINPLLSLGPECKVASLDATFSAMAVFLNGSGAEAAIETTNTQVGDDGGTEETNQSKAKRPETGLPFTVSHETLALIVDSVQCVAANVHGQHFKLGRYTLSDLLTLLSQLCASDSAVCERVLTEHFTIVRALIHVLQNYMEGNPTTVSGGGLDDEDAVRQSFDLLYDILHAEIQKDEELGRRLQGYGLGAIAHEIIDRVAPREGTLLLRLKCWGSDLPVRPRPASTLRKEILSHNATVTVLPPPEPYIRKKGQKKSKHLSNEVLQRHEYYELISGGSLDYAGDQKSLATSMEGDVGSVGNGTATSGTAVKAERGFLKIQSADHCFVPVKACSSATTAAAHRIIQMLPLADVFGSGSLVTTAASGRKTADALVTPTLDRRDGVKDVFTLDYDSEEDEYDKLLSTKGHSKHILISYAKGCENQENVHVLAKYLRLMGFRVFCDDGSVGFKMDPRKEEGMDAAPLIIVAVSKKYHSTCREEAAYARLLQSYGKTQLVFFMTNENYHTDSHPFRVSGWLGNMLTKGGVVWFPGWTRFQAMGSAEEIRAIVNRTVDAKTANMMRTNEA